MALGKQKKTEHGGGKTSDAKSGYWGLRFEAKKYSKKLRRRADKKAANDADADMA